MILNDKHAESKSLGKNIPGNPVKNNTSDALKSVIF